MLLAYTFSQTPLLQGIVVISLAADFLSTSLLPRKQKSMTHTIQALVVLGIASNGYSVIVYGIK